ncbi:MAG: hypothetical protein RLY61_977 [Candidatus Parcubacteria bacterium]|jgi:UDP-N-acetylmuramoyl-L-alanyl-D-glutamate--2,6-diaminopimelate ligase
MLETIKKAVILGAGGGANFYIAKFLHLYGINVVAYDQSKNSKTEELSKLGCAVIYSNPISYNFPDSDVVIYTQALPTDIQSLIRQENDVNKVHNSGVFYKMLIDAFEKGEWAKDKHALHAFTTSNIAPLMHINFHKCLLIGVTGSKGKTTTTNMLYQALTSLGVKTSLVSTLGARILDKELETGLHTSTPSAQELAELFNTMLAVGSKVIVVEVSSHGIATGRITGLKFDYGVITNIQPEHLDFHKDIAEVIAVKETLITHYLKKTGKAILNYDDENIRQYVMPKVLKCLSDVNLITTQNLQTLANTLNVESIKEDNGQTSFSLTDSTYTSHETYTIPFSGCFNIYNVIPTIVIAKALGFTYHNISKALCSLNVIAGRNEVVVDDKIKIILDFAHTAESLEAILQTYSTKKSGKLIVVFGCAGQRDPQKRVRMGEVAARYADITILTAEDPRTEELKSINDQIETGYNAYAQENALTDTRQLYRFDDTTENIKCRSDAIRKAIDVALSGDTIICAGKGPEKSMCFGTTEYEWDEKAEIIRLYSSLKVN